MEKLSIRHEGQSLIDLLEVFLSFSILFGADEEANVSEQMLQTCVNIINHEKQEAAQSEDGDELLLQLVNNKLFKWLCSGLNFNTAHINRKKTLIIQIQTMLFSIQGQLFDRLEKRVEIAAEINTFITDRLKQRAIFEDGKSFKYLASSLQLKHILQNEEEARRIRDKAKEYATDSKMYQVPIKFDLAARDLPLKVHFKKMSTSCAVKLIPESIHGCTMTFTKDLMRDGFKNFVIGAKQRVQVSFEPSSQVLHYSNAEYGCSYNGSDFEAHLKSLDSTVKQVVCALSNSTFVCEDESIYAVGKPFVFRDRELDAKSQDKTWYKLNKPQDCVDYRKVDASGSNRLILTNSGQLYCQGENLRLYIQKGIKPDDMAQEFVNCTDVFPVSAGDKIVDMAAGYFYTVVVTEQGKAFAVGLEAKRTKLRSRSHPNQASERKPAYEIKLPGKAIKCWANKWNSISYVQIVDDQGKKRVFSGCEFITARNRDHIQILCRGDNWRSEFTGPSIWLDRPPYKEMRFPESVVIKKIDA